MHFTVSRRSVSRKICDKQHHAASTSNLTVCLKHWDFKIPNVLDGSYTLFFPYILSTQNMVRVIEGKIIEI